MIKTDKGHFWITFDNGYTISLFNGFGSYSDNHFSHSLINIPEYIPIESKNCEIAIFDKDNNFVTKDILECEDDVKGYVTISELIEIINKVNKI